MLEVNKVGNLEPTVQSESSDENFVGIDYSILLKTYENLVRKKKDKYSSDFHFGWTGNPNIANSIAMKYLTLPNLLIIEKKSMKYYEPDVEISKLSDKTFEYFLDAVLDKTAKVSKLFCYCLI